MRILPGVYKYTTTLELSGEDGGDNPESMVVYEGYGGKVVFDGGLGVGGWEKMGEDIDARVGKGGQGKMWGVKVGDGIVGDLLRGREVGDERVVLVMGGELMRVARWPERGYVLVGKVRGGREKSGELGNAEMAKGAEFMLREKGVVERWRNELEEKRGKGVVVGYIDSDFRRSTLRMFGVNGDYLRLMDGGSYGVENRKDKPRRFYVRNMMTELDNPGEWYYDEDDDMIYMYPLGDMDEDVEVFVGTGPAVFGGAGVSHVKIKNIIFQHKAPGDNTEDSFVYFKGESVGNVVEGCVFRDSPSAGVSMDTSTRESIIRDSDFYNLGMFFRIGGGILNGDEIVSFNHQAINNHCTMTVGIDLYPTVAVKGVGTRFENNLIHNVPNQVVNNGGVDHMIKKNEVFNVGFEEGDGGAFYGGGALWSYGNLFKHNFIHHLISVPDLYPRAAFYSDDHDGGDTYEENVLYKGGGDGIKMNKGGGHSVTRNVILNGDAGIWSSARNSDQDFATAKDFLDNNPDSGEKENYFGRAQEIWGKDGWKQGPWIEKFPKLQIVMKMYFEKKTMKPFECRFYDNLFVDTKENINAPSMIPTKGNRDIDAELFEDPSTLNFKFKSGRPPYAPDIPFEEIGLVITEARKWVPDKSDYRSAVRERFAETDVDDNGPYDSNTVDDLLYYNSGEQIFGGTASNARAPGEEAR